MPCLLIYKCMKQIHSNKKCPPLLSFSLCTSVLLLTASALQMVLATWRQSVRSQALLTVSSPASWKLNNKFSCSVGGRTTKANAFTHSEGRNWKSETRTDSDGARGKIINSDKSKRVLKKKKEIRRWEEKDIRKKKGRSRECVGRGDGRRNCWKEMSRKKWW